MITTLQQFVDAVTSAYARHCSPDEAQIAALIWAGAGTMAYSSSTNRPAQELQDRGAWDQWVVSGSFPESAARWIWEGFGTSENQRWRVIQAASLATSDFFDNLKARAWPTSADLLEQLEAQSTSDDVRPKATRQLLVEIAKQEVANATVVTPTRDALALNVELARAGLRVAASSLPTSLPISLACQLQITSLMDRTHGEAWSFTTFEQLDDLDDAIHVVGVLPMGIRGAYDLSRVFGEKTARKSDPKSSAELEVLRYALEVSGDHVIAVAPPSVLFRKGQHADFRQACLRAGILRSASSLPAGAIAETTLAPALLQFLPGEERVLLSDLSDFSTDSYNDVASVLDVIFARLPAHECVTVVASDNVSGPEWSLQPSRYLKAVWVEEGAPLRDLFDVVRAPPAKVDHDAVDASEVGVADLSADGWEALVSGRKSTRVAPYRLRQCRLNHGDLVISTKATLGKASIVAAEDSAHSNPMVVANTCIALRPRHPSIPAQHLSAYLLLYMRSETGQQQLESLASGTTIKQLSARRLLEDFQVPAPTAKRCHRAFETVGAFADEERRIRAKQDSLSAAAAGAWDAIQ